MWDQDYKRKPAGPSLLSPERKKFDIQIPDVSGAIAKIDSAVNGVDNKIINKPFDQWTDDEITARIAYLQINEPHTFLMLMMTGCTCFLDGSKK